MKSSSKDIDSFFSILSRSIGLGGLYILEGGRVIKIYQRGKLLFRVVFLHFLHRRGRYFQKQCGSEAAGLYKTPIEGDLQSTGRTKKVNIEVDLWVIR